MINLAVEAATSDTPIYFYGQRANGDTRKFNFVKLAQALVKLPELKFPVIDVTRPEYGVVRGGGVSQSPAIQAAIDAAPVGATIMFGLGDIADSAPAGNFYCTTPIEVNKTLAFTSMGSKGAGALIFAGCDGFHVNKIHGVSFSNMLIAQAVRHTVTPNTYLGIKFDGDTTNRAFDESVSHVSVDGFLTAISCHWMWSSNFHAVTTGSCKNGIFVTGQSVNNTIHAGSFSGDQTGHGISLDGFEYPSEGMMISDCLTYNNFYGVYARAFVHSSINNCILDYNYKAGVFIVNGTANFGGNWGITNNFIGVAGGSGTACVWLQNAIANSQNRGTRVTGNFLLGYAGATVSYGVYVVGTEAKHNNIQLNTIDGITSYDIRVNVTNSTNIVSNNQCLSPTPTNNIDTLGECTGNTGQVYYRLAANWTTVGRMRITYSNAAPTTGDWKDGDICWHSEPVAGGVPGWMCTTTGTPGIWKAMANLAA